MKFRYLLVFLTFLLTIILYVDRVCISVAKEDIVGELGLSDQQMGWVLSAFALGYALFQTPSGIFADRRGPRLVLSLIVGLWSLFTALTGMVRTFVQLLVVRTLFGAGEAGAFPGISRVVYSWIPMQERGIVMGINFSGSRLGAAFALPFVAWLITTLGWRESFYVLGLIGLVWGAVWYAVFRDDPAEHPLTRPEEREEILRTRQVGTGQKMSLRFSTVAGSRNMWLIMLQYFSSNFTFFFCLTWLFPYIKDTYELEAMQAGFYASAPLLFGAAGNWFSGFLVDRIYARGKWKLSRQLPAMVGFLLAAVGLLASLYMDTVSGAVLFLSIAIFGADMTLSPSWAFCVDIGKDHAGAVSGTMNMAGNLGSFLTALAFPYLQDWTGSVGPFFFIGACLNLLALVVWYFLDPRKALTKHVQVT